MPASLNTLPTELLLQIFSPLTSYSLFALSLAGSRPLTSSALSVLYTSPLLIHHRKLSHLRLAPSCRIAYTQSLSTYGPGVDNDIDPWLILALPQLQTLTLSLPLFFSAGPLPCAASITSLTFATPSISPAARIIVACPHLQTLDLTQTLDISAKNEEAAVCDLQLIADSLLHCATTLRKLAVRVDFINSMTTTASSATMNMSLGDRFCAYGVGLARLLPGDTFTALEELEGGVIMIVGWGNSKDMGVLYNGAMRRLVLRDDGIELDDLKVLMARASCWAEECVNAAVAQGRLEAVTVVWTWKEWPICNVNDMEICCSKQGVALQWEAGGRFRREGEEEAPAAVVTAAERDGGKGRRERMPLRRQDGEWWVQSHPDGRWNSIDKWGRRTNTKKLLGTSSI